MTPFNLRKRTINLLEGLYSLLSDEKIDHNSHQSTYVTQFLLAQANINYLEDKPIELAIDLSLKPLKHTLEYYETVNQSDKSEIKRIAGFVNNNNAYTKLRDIETYKGATNEEMYSKAGHKVRLPIIPIQQGKNGRLVHMTKIDAKYDELRSNDQKVPHNFFVELNALTKKSVYVFIVPIGNHSYTEDIKIKIKDGAHHTLALSQALPTRILSNHFFYLTNNYGNGWIEYREEVKQIVITVVVQKELGRGSACKIEWDTIRK